MLRCLYVADPATFLASNTVPGTLFSSENSLSIQLQEKKISVYYYLIYTVHLKNVSLK